MALVVHKPLLKPIQTALGRRDFWSVAEEHPQVNAVYGNKAMVYFLPTNEKYLFRPQDQYYVEQLTNNLCCPWSNGTVSLR